MQVDISKITMLCSLVESLIKESGPGQGLGVITGDKSKARIYVCQIFIWSALWSIGGNLLQSSREKLQDVFKETFEELPESK